MPALAPTAWRSRPRRTCASTCTTPSTGSRGARRRTRSRARREPAAARLDRLLRLPLVPRDGARELRGRRDRGADERAVRLHQGRPRGAPRRRRDLHGGLPADERPGRLAAERVPDPGAADAVLRRHLLPAGAAARDAELADGARGDRRRLGGAARADRRAGRSRSRDALGASARLEPSAEPLTRRGCWSTRSRLLRAALRRASTAAGAARRSSRRPGDRVPARPWRARAWRSRPCARWRSGGIYDQVGGGFARYAVDATWTVPHFEKMLYDNALLARAYLHG